jgi:hypothetical protein
VFVAQNKPDLHKYRGCASVLLTGKEIAGELCGSDGKIQGMPEMECYQRGGT